MRRSKKVLNMSEKKNEKLKNIVEELSSQYLVVLLPDDDEPVVSVQLESEDEKTVVPFEIPARAFRDDPQ
jgi:vacuolar-type H+-ATPase subunit E/Vma4